MGKLDYTKTYHPGIIEERVKDTAGYKIKKYPTFEAGIKQSQKYILDLGTKKIKIASKKGKPIELDECVLTSPTPSFWERIKIIFSLIYHISNKDWYSSRMRRLNCISPDEVDELKKYLDEYNDEIEKYAKVNKQKITIKNKIKEIETTEDNLATLIEKIEESKNRTFSFYT